jgi:hypothetical protein
VGVVVVVGRGGGWGHGGCARALGTSWQRARVCVRAVRVCADLVQVERGREHLHEGLRVAREAPRVRNLLLLGGVRGPQPAELLRGDHVRPQQLAQPDGHLVGGGGGVRGWGWGWG